MPTPPPTPKPYALGGVGFRVSFSRTPLPPLESFGEPDNLGQAGLAYHTTVGELCEAWGFTPGTRPHTKVVVYYSPNHHLCEGPRLFVILRDTWWWLSGRGSGLVVDRPRKRDLRAISHLDPNPKMIVETF